MNTYTFNKHIRFVYMLEKNQNIRIKFDESHLKNSYSIYGNHDKLSV